MQFGRAGDRHDVGTLGKEPGESNLRGRGALLASNAAQQVDERFVLRHRLRLEPYVREEALLAQFTDMLDRFSVSDDVLEWVINALQESFGVMRKDHDAAIWRLQVERDRLQERMKQIYIDNLDGRIEEPLFNALTKEFRDQERRVTRELELRFEANLSYMDDGVALMSIARGAQRRFMDADLNAKKHMLSAVLSNCSFRDRKLSATYRKPFDILVENLPAELGDRAVGVPADAGSPNWQGRSDSNRGPSVLETDALTN